MLKENKKLLELCLRGLTNKNIDEKNFKDFSKDYTKYPQGELTFRELMASVKQPKGELKEAMLSYYAGSVYQRAFKDR